LFGTWRVNQFHAGLLGLAIALDAIAVAAGRDYVHPMIAAAARQRRDVVAGKAQVSEFSAAIGANMAIAAKQFAIVERRHLRKTPGRHRLALDGDDGICGNARALAGFARSSAIESERSIAQRPCHQVLGVVVAGLLPGYPAVGNAVKI
jgi:hypothetical protein